MDRREFLRAGFLSAATAASISAEPYDKRLGRKSVSGTKKLTISNDFLAWQLEWSKEGLRTCSFENKFSGRLFQFSAVEELGLTFSAARHRIEIPWWDFTYGPDNTPVSPESEKGYLLGYHLKTLLHIGGNCRPDIVLGYLLTFYQNGGL